MTNPYRRIFSAPGAVAFVVAGFVGRMGHFMTVLGIVFLIAASTGSYGLAGAVSGGYALAYSAVSPLTSRLVDRYRQGRVLIPATMANVVARAGFLAAVWLGAAGWTLVLLGAFAGATMPAIGSLVRARWSHLYRASPLLHPALSFESVVDETILIVAPVAVATLAVYLNPSAGLIVALLLAAAGPAALAAQRDTEPPPPHTARAGGTPLSVPGFASLLAAFVAVAMATITIELATVAFSQQHHAPAAGGPVLAALALSSAICGLWYGARERRREPQRRLALTLALFAAATLGFVAAGSVGALFIAALVLGPTLAPTFINGFSLVHRVVPARHLTEGLTWLTTASGAGIALGSALAGRAIDAWGTRATFGLATCYATLAIPIGLAGLVRLNRRPPPTTGPETAVTRSLGCAAPVDDCGSGDVGDVCYDGVGHDGALSPPGTVASIRQIGPLGMDQRGTLRAAVALSTNPPDTQDLLTIAQSGDPTAKVSNSTGIGCSRGNERVQLKPAV